ncbi:MAG: hypothetical protein U5K74_08095 [Gemmatimonadaceae bacterium]|nr:hypothetical protein [Gemmatimonadaceae bacterium]
MSLGVTTGAMVGLAVTGALVGVPLPFVVLSPELKNAASASCASQ